MLKCLDKNLFVRNNAETKMPEFVPVPVQVREAVATKVGCELVAVYVNPATVMMVKPSDEEPKDWSVIHFINGETLKVAENFGQLSAKLSYPEPIVPER